MNPDVSARRRRDVLDALRRGAVPANGLDVLAVGLDRFTTAVDDDLDRVATGGSVFKAVRGEYGAGKTFFTRWLAERAKRRGFATAEIQISETETPLHRMETVYRRLTERLATEQFQPSALRPVLDSWIYALEEDVLAAGKIAETDATALGRAVGELLEQRLAAISRGAPGFAAALRAYRSAAATGDDATAEGLAAWLGGLMLVITGTPAFYDGPQGVQRLAPLAQRLATDFGPDPRWDNPRATQIRLPGFDLDALTELAGKVRGLDDGRDVAARVDDDYLRQLAVAVTGRLGGNVGIAPRVFLKKLVADVLDRVDQFADFDPRQHYALTVRADELTATERNAASAALADNGPVHCADDIDLPI